MRVRKTKLEAYRGFQAYVGDLHNHCGISYGHGSIEQAFANAREQLDFASVTGHAWWHDMPADDGLLSLRKYHLDGFEKLGKNWSHVQDVTARMHQDGSFVTFLSFEWHSMINGDHCVYYKGPSGPLLRSDSIDELRKELRELRTSGLDSMMLPHHVGYLKGHRGANWEVFTPEFTPIVEAISMHGLALEDDGPHPYLHTMGPVDGRSTIKSALERGLRFGIIGSTDHHSAHPGSHGYGRAMVWAPELTRDGLWQGLANRCTYAVSGDPITLAIDVNGAVMGNSALRSGPAEIAVDVSGVDEVETVEIHRNGELLTSDSPAEVGASDDFKGVLGVTVGWGQLGQNIDWDIVVRIERGRFISVEPRFHGHDVVAPSERTPEHFYTSRWKQVDAAKVTLTTCTSGNPSATSDATQGLALFAEAEPSAELVVTANGLEFRQSIAELLSGSRTMYIGGFVSGAVKLHRATRSQRLNVSIETTDYEPGSYYTAHVRQRNEQHAWSSPVWLTH